MVAEVIKLLHQNEFYGAGENTEIAKGNRELISTYSDMKRKIKRQWLSRKKLQ